MKACPIEAASEKRDAKPFDPSSPMFPIKPATETGANPPEAMPSR